MNLKKLMAGALAAFTCFGCALGASANSTVKSTVSVPDTDTHTYSIYQIFTGDSEGSTLTSVKWGASAPSGKTVGSYVTHDDLVKLEAIQALTSDVEKLKGTATTDPLTNFVDLTKPTGTVKAGSSVDVEEGYYLFKDADTLTGSDTYSLYISQVAQGNPISISRKAATSVPTVVKQVEENGTYGNGADAAKGDTINFKVTGTLPADLSNYSLYKYTLTDTPSTGLTLNTADAKVYVGGTEVKEGFTITKDGTKLVFSCDDILTKLKDASGNAIAVTASSNIIFTYTGSLNDSAVLGTAGNANSAVLSYSNNPNDTSATESKSSVDDSVKTYTYKLIINELDEKDPAEALEGVGLTLSKKAADGTYVPVGSEVTGVTTFEWTELDAGDYKLEETTTPAGYKTMTAKTFSITSDIDADGNLKDLTSTLDGATVSVTDGTVTASIVNATKTALPVTGAVGLVCLALAGAGAGCAAIVLKKKGKEDY